MKKNVFIVVFIVKQKLKKNRSFASISMLE